MLVCSRESVTLASCGSGLRSLEAFMTLYLAIEMLEVKALFILLYISHKQNFSYTSLGLGLVTGGGWVCLVLPAAGATGVKQLQAHSNQ